MSRILHLLAIHPDVQERLRSEINSANPEGVDLPYEEIMALPILDAVYKETVRVSVLHHVPVTKNAHNSSPTDFLLEQPSCGRQ